jgi:hypothetical protein
MKKEMKRLFILLIAMLAIFFCCTLCTPQQRLNHLVKKHPELVRTDTVTIADTTITPGSYADTIVSLLASRTDTVVIRQDNIITKVFTHLDSIYISSTALPDTIVKQIPVPYRYVQPVEEKKDNWPWWKMAYDALIALLLLLMLSKRKRSNQTAP